MGVISLKILRHQWFWSYEISDFQLLPEKSSKFEGRLLSLMVLDGLI
jgi:hypothetical protein